MVLTKDGSNVVVHDKFIYSDEIYYKFKEGISIYSTTHYVSDKPIKVKKKDLLSKRTKDGYFVRFFNLEFAPLNWLIENGYIEKNNKIVKK